MISSSRRLTVSLLAMFLFSNFATLRSFGQREWVDRDTGHRVVRLSDEAGSRSLYFTQQAFLCDGRLVYSSPGGIRAVDPDSRKSETLVPGKARLIEVGRRQGGVYFRRDRTLFVYDPETRGEREIATLPPRWNIDAINCDETLAAGTVTLTDDPDPARDRKPMDEAEFMKQKGRMMEERLAKKLPMELFTLDLKTGKVANRFNHCTDWLNHVQFSPTDPQQLLFCHEGLWHKVTRTWIIRADGSGLKDIHKRTMPMEIAGHEFWGSNGSTVWYDLQTPRGEVFWLAGYHVKTGDRTWFHLKRDEWSVHYNISPDGKLFAGDGGGPDNVARAKDGKWIYLFRPEFTDHPPAPLPSETIRSGVLKSEKLVNMSGHDYSVIEPNAVFSPDGRWIVFRSNMHGEPHIYAVEVAKADAR
jgi:oligogalacturonide lyase